MKNTSLVLGALLVSLSAAGCDDGAGTGGAGGAGTTGSTSSKSGSTTGTTTGSTTSSSTTSASTTGSSSSSGGGNCITLDPGMLMPGGMDDDILFGVPTLGDPAKLDEFDIQFYGTPYMPVTGTFDLTSVGNNDNFATCDQCIFFSLDVDPVTELEAKFFFQSEGTLTVTDTDASIPNISQGSITNVKLVEVTLDANFVSTPVPGGDCYIIPTLAWDTKP